MFLPHSFVFLLHVAYRVFYKSLQGRHMDVRESIDVDACAAADFVLTQLFEERAIALKTLHDVDRKALHSRRKAGERPISLLRTTL